MVHTEPNTRIANAKTEIENWDLAHWRNLANTIEPPVCYGNAALSN